MKKYKIVPSISTHGEKCWRILRKVLFLFWIDAGWDFKSLEDAKNYMAHLNSRPVQ